MPNGLPILWQRRSSSQPITGARIQDSQDVKDVIGRSRASRRDMRRRDKTACIKADWRLFGVPIPQAFQIVRYLLVRPAGFFHTSWGYGPLLRRLFIHMKPTSSSGSSIRGADTGKVRCGAPAKKQVVRPILSSSKRFWICSSTYQTR